VSELVDWITFSVGLVIAFLFTLLAGLLRFYIVTRCCHPDAKERRAARYGLLA
jgi:hypothetical protein